MTNKEKYSELCKENSTISVYDQPWWLDAVCGKDNWEVVLYEKNGTILGAMPCYIKSKFGLKYITQPQFTQHNGVWIRYPDNQIEAKRISYEKEVIGSLLEEIEKMPIYCYLQAHSPKLTNWLPFYWRGYKQTTYYTYRLPDIHDTEVVFKNFQPNKRKNINKARKAGYTIKFDLADENFYKHHKKSLKKQGVDIQYSFDIFQQIYHAAYENKSGRTIYAEDENGTLLCALFNLWDRKWGYDLISAIDPDTRKSGVPDLLVYTMLEYLSDKVIGYDFEGSMIPGVEESFRHFGAIQTPYFLINKIYTKNYLIKKIVEKKLR
ncbi:MAG: GNAT family N-acetyltransferase [Oscillospiraceae bacterium]|nr:GNAT family N-acetyltransferase [Oscillospiraceae bacterium]